MPYIMVMGSLSAPHLSKDEGATVYGLKSEERATLVRELNSSFGMTIAVSNDQERTVRVTQKGLTLVVVNRLHGLLGYDVVSHSMAMTNANRELVSFSMYKKSSPSSHGHGSSHSHSHTHGHSHTSHSKVHTHGDVLTTL
ncbi:dual 3',5'-cyclic-AMP and -GMP phosphodiesterase 11 isoform X2 [Amyelois transitella]|uniref:dual 3',5'-cyclic-AMP and -GMP phosphodiesterase 11 isoform X2 n=1 Tax=Amyelois transitella TaxID=680683 RepID=UPI00067D80A9|nr:dual 3',5'-cyclic-AMP and -GMP phosphodiesterase 11 isoform X2 [Amyelois transitella]